MNSTCMVKDLFVRDFDEKLHAKASQIATDDGITLASIVSDAVEKWIKNHEKNRHRHYLILYDDEKTLSKLLNEIDKLASDNWFRSSCGSAKHYGMQYLSKRKWFDATAGNYDKLLDNPQVTGNKVLEIIGNKLGNKFPLTVAFIVEDLARKESVRKAVGFCEWYESKSLPGITYCIANTKNIISGSFDDLFDLFNVHNAMFLTEGNRLYRLRLDEERSYSLLN
jgi:hypothetical protein